MISCCSCYSAGVPPAVHGIEKAPRPVLQPAAAMKAQHSYIKTGQVIFKRKRKGGGNHLIKRER